MKDNGGSPDDGITSAVGGGPPEDSAAGLLVASDDPIRCIEVCGGSGGSPVVFFAMCDYEKG